MQTAVLCPDDRREGLIHCLEDFCRNPTGGVRAMNGVHWIVRWVALFLSLSACLAISPARRVWGFGRGKHVRTLRLRGGANSDANRTSRGSSPEGSSLRGSVGGTRIWKDIVSSAFGGEELEGGDGGQTQKGNVASGSASPEGRDTGLRTAVGIAHSRSASLDVHAQASNLKSASWEVEVEEGEGRPSSLKPVISMHTKDTHALVTCLWASMYSVG